ncbi:hypothetical protein [Corynebacterium cystitidis]|nr:hypothetical protein [Corynebacterium cystitidis]
MRKWISSTFGVIYESDSTFHLLLKHTGLRFIYPSSVKAGSVPGLLL